MLELKDLNYITNEKVEEKEILKNINLTFEDNKIYAITGPNGSGKSTLAKIIMGIVTPNSGKIIFDGKDITSLDIDKRAKLGISYAFQTPITFKGLKIRDLLDVASGKQNNFGQICDILSSVGLCAKDYINRPLDASLSGGELKRIEIAMVLCRNAKLNIFDEPEAGIDLWSFDNLTDIFKSLASSTNIIVSHQEKILELSDYIILLKDGQIEKMGSRQEMLPCLQLSRCSRLKR